MLRRNLTNVFEAMDEGSKMTVGEKGSLAYTSIGVGDPRVALCQKMARDYPRESIVELVERSRMSTQKAWIPN